MLLGFLQSCAKGKDQRRRIFRGLTEAVTDGGAFDLQRRLQLSWRVGLTVPRLLYDGYELRMSEDVHVHVLSCGAGIPPKMEKIGRRAAPAGSLPGVPRKDKNVVKALSSGASVTPPRKSIL